MNISSENSFEFSWNRTRVPMITNVQRWPLDHRISVTSQKICLLNNYACYASNITFSGMMVTFIIEISRFFRLFYWEISLGYTWDWFFFQSEWSHRMNHRRHCYANRPIHSFNNLQQQELCWRGDVLRCHDSINSIGM